MSTNRASKICFGTEALGGTDWGDVSLKEIENALNLAFEKGVRMFDTAAIYGLSLCEMRLGKLFKDKIYDIEIATKGGLSWEASAQGRAKVWCDSSREALLKGIDESCKRLGRSYLDVYYIHWPDRNTSFSETFETLQFAKEQGRIKHIGVSNLTIEDIRIASAYAKISYVQAPANILHANRNKELREYCDKRSIKFVCYNVLASGLLTGKYAVGHKFPDTDRRHRLSEFQPEAMSAILKESSDWLKLSSWEGDIKSLALSWAFAQQDISKVIVGIKSKQQLVQNLEAEDALSQSSIDMLKQL